MKFVQNRAALDEVPPNWVALNDAIQSPLYLRFRVNEKGYVGWKKWQSEDRGHNDPASLIIFIVRLLFRPASMSQFADFWKSVITETDVWYSIACSNGTWFLTALALLLCKWHFWYFLIIYWVICPVSHHQWHQCLQVAHQCLQNARKGCALLMSELWCYLVV